MISLECISLRNNDRFFLLHLSYIALFDPEPEVIKNLTVTNVTTWSMSVNWTKPEGYSSFYIVNWTDGNTTNVTDTFINITNLSAGVQYTITVRAVAADGSTSGDGTSTKRYTSK